MKKAHAIKTKFVRFSQLRKLLLDLDFTEERNDKYWRFEHPESGALFLFRPYASEDIVSVPDLGTTRMHLDWRGLLSPDAFDDSLTKTPA